MYLRTCSIKYNIMLCTLEMQMFWQYQIYLLTHKNTAKFILLFTTSLDTSSLSILHTFSHAYVEKMGGAWDEANIYTKHPVGNHLPPHRSSVMLHGQPALCFQQTQMAPIQWHHVCYLELCEWAS